MNTIWVKSSLSFSNGNCVEVARLPGGAVGVRDSGDPGGPVLRFTPGEWGVFVGRARLGEFDRCGAAPGSEPSSARPGEAVHAVATCRSRRIPRSSRRREMRAIRPA